MRKVGTITIGYCYYLLPLATYKFPHSLTNIMFYHFKFVFVDFPGGAVVKNLPANAGDMGPIPGPGRPHTPRGN